MKLKRLLLIFSGFITLIIVSGFFLIVFPFLGTKKVINNAEFANGRITTVVDGMSQVYIINGADGNIGLVDAGNSPDGKPILEALALKGLKPSDIKSIFLTHGHHDHIAAAKIFTNAKIYSLKEEIEIAEGTGNGSSPIGYIFKASPTGLKVTDILNDNEVIDFGSLKIEVFSIPGHTNGSAAYLIGGVVFMGDSALSSSDGKIRQAVWAFSNDVKQENRSLKSLAVKLLPRKNEITNIVFSHSGHLEGLQPLIDFGDTVH
jgi:glyoxylase-like metal-dependent hydrolase (beta-lactamase superfamily II)